MKEYYVIWTDGIDSFPITVYYIKRRSKLVLSLYLALKILITLHAKEKKL